MSCHQLVTGLTQRDTLTFTYLKNQNKQTNTKTPFKYSLRVDDYHSNENKFLLFFLKVYNTENSCESQKVTAFDRAGSCMTHILTPRYHQTRALTNRRFKVVKPCCKSKGAEWNGYIFCFHLNQLIPFSEASFHTFPFLCLH